MEHVYRGYSITLEDCSLFFRVYVSPTKPDLPISHRNHFEWCGTQEEALEMARRQIEVLVGAGNEE